MCVPAAKCGWCGSAERHLSPPLAPQRLFFSACPAPDLFHGCDGLRCSTVLCQTMHDLDLARGHGGMLTFTFFFLFFRPRKGAADGSDILIRIDSISFGF